MKDITNTEGVDQIHKCKYCGNEHAWHQIYYGVYAKLKKIEATYIAWCKTTNSYVILNRNK